MPDYRTIITTVGQNKLAAAILGPALVLQKMAVGDAAGVGYDPAEEQLALTGQVYEADLDSVETLAGGIIVCEMTIPADQGGWHIREACVKDDDGDIIAICRIADRYKPLPTSGQADELTIRMRLDVGNVGDVTWDVDLTRKAKIDGQLRPDFRSVEDFLNDPPVAPVAGQTWVVGGAPTGAWAGHEDELAEWSGVGWTFVAPTPWMLVGRGDRTDWRWNHAAEPPAWVNFTDVAFTMVPAIDRTPLATGFTTMVCDTLLLGSDAAAAVGADSRFVAPRSGLYMFVTNLNYASQDGATSVNILVNPAAGGSFYVASSNIFYGASSNTAGSAVAVTRLVEGDVVRPIQYNQNTTNIISSAGFTSFSGVLLKGEY